MALFEMAPSLRRKIAFAYFAIAFLTLALSLFAFEELRLLENKILLGERVAEIFDTALEIRRFERNYFLHGQTADFQENARYCEHLLQLLDSDRADFAALGAIEGQAALRRELADYRRLMDTYPAATEPAALEPRIRGAGQRLVASAEAVVGTERQQVHSSLATFQTLLIVAVGGVALLTIGIGQILARRVAQPLQRIEEGVNAISGGERSLLEMPDDDREIVSVVAAINHLLHDLELRRKHLVRAEKLASMGTMVSGVAHELNNPISNIWSSCQILAEDAALSADQRELLRQIDEQSIRARNIVRSLLDFGRERPFAYEAVALNELVQQTLRFLKAELPPTLEVQVTIAPELTLHADRQRLQQALLNLIKNAVEAADSRVVIAAELLPAYAAPPADPGLAPCQGAPYVEIRVEDDGAGIPADILPRVFDPFFTTKDVGKGMGLGLYIVYRVVDEHDGCIVANSAAGCTAFILRLPAAHEKAART